MAKKPDLASMSVQALVNLREEIANVLSRKADEFRAQLAAINDAAQAHSSEKKTRKVAPKYRGPKGELWSGRGLKPRWLTAELKQGKKLENFAIQR